MLKNKNTLTSLLSNSSLLHQGTSSPTLADLFTFATKCYWRFFFFFAFKFSSLSFPKIQFSMKDTTVNFRYDVIDGTLKRLR